MALTRQARREAVSSCRRCPVACERVVYPAGCIAASCSRLYAYEEAGRTYIGCLARVYEVEIDLDAFRRLERTKGGFGALRAMREPLPVCRTEIERTFEHRDHGACVNPDFLLSAPHRPYTVTALADGRGEDVPA